ncbi:MAG: DegV family protein [Clostridia bacterium]|nr:DegV family protein [Clostridia bacterium]
MKKVKILVDTGADISEEIAQKYDIGVINFLCTFDEKSYIAGEELSNAEFYEKLLASDELPKTSQTPPAVMYDKLLEAAKEYDSVVYFTISKNASGQYNNARMNAEQIKEEYPDCDIRVIDTMTFSAYIGETAIKFRELLNDGADIDEALQEAHKMLSYYEVYILVDSLKFLEKGGRIKKTAAIVGELLEIKPILGIRDGLIEPIERIRGKKKMIKKLVELIAESDEFDDKSKEFIIVESNKDYGDEAEELIKEEFNGAKITRRYEFGPIIGTHIGNNALAILFKRKF